MMQTDQLNKEKDRQTDIEIALIQAESAEKNASANLQKMMQDFQIKQQDLAIKEKAIDAKSQDNFKNIE